MPEGIEEVTFELVGTDEESISQVLSTCVAALRIVAFCLQKSSLDCQEGEGQED